MREQIATLRAERAVLTAELLVIHAINQEEGDHHGQ
jgi:hypothetical protein